MISGHNEFNPISYHNNTKVKGHKSTMLLMLKHKGHRYFLNTFCYWNVLHVLHVVNTDKVIVEKIKFV